MSMYKNIFVTEEVNASGEQTISINGEINLYGEGAFTSLEEAVAAVAAVEQNAVIRVQSGKYDSFYVATEGVLSTPNKVIAVDFDGGEAMIGGEVITVADSGIEAEQQASILADLNDISAGEGKVFVAAGDAPADATTLYVGMGDYGYVAGAAASVVTGSSMDEIANNFVENVISKPVEATAVSNGIYVSNEYNSSTEGYGTTHFNNYAGAYAYAKENNKKATIVIEKTNTLSGNTFDNAHKDYKNLAVVIKDGASLGDALSKWDMTYKVTVEAGGKITAARPSNASTSNIHIKNALVLQGEPGKAAVFDLLSDSYADGDISLRYNGSITAENAIIKVQDLDCQGKITLTDTKVTVDGAFATATSSFYKSTFTNCEIAIGGTQISGGLSDFSGGNANQLGNTTLNNTTMTFGAGAVVNVKSDVTMTGKSALNVGTLNIDSGKTLKMDSNSALSLEALTGSGKIEINLLDGFTSGSKLINFKNDNATEDMLSKITLKGKEGFAMIQEGDIYVFAGKANADLDFTEDEKNTLEGEVVAKTVEITNSKELAVTGEINAFDSATITNEAAADETGKDGVLNGGYDADGKELAAKITAGNNIVIQNDGHANVELDAKNIVIANNSNETLIGNIGTAATESVEIAAGTATADGVNVSGNGDVDGAIKNATITATNISIADQIVTDTTFNGTTTIAADSTLEDSQITGIAYVGHKQENAADTTLTLKGESSIGTLYVGNEGRTNQYTAKIEGADTVVTLGNLYNRTDSVVEITDGATANIGYWQSKGSVVIDDATVNHTGVNMYVYNNDSTSVAEIKLTNGAVLNSDANYAIYLGNSENGPAKGNASLVLESGSTLNTKNLILHAEGTVEEVAGAKASTNVSVTDSTVNVTGTLTNNGTFTVAGESTLNIATLTGSGKLVLGAADKATDISGTANVAVATEIASGAEVTLSGNYTSSTMLVGAPKYANDGVEGFDLTIAENANAAFSAMYVSGTSKLNVDGTLDAGGTLNVYGANFAVSDTGTITAETANITGNAEIKGDANFTFLKVGQAMDSANYQSGKVVFDGGNWESSLGSIYVGEAYVKDDADDPRKFAAMSEDGNKNAALVLKNGASIVLKENSELRGVVDITQNASVELSGNSTLSVQNINNAGTISVTDSYLKTGVLTNNGYISVSGESTLNIGSLAGSGDVDLLDGAIIKDSTVGGDASVVGKVTFAGDNTFNNLYDFGTYYASYYNGANAEIVVEEGASLTLTHKVGNAYGLGYGDKLTVNGSLVDAREVDRSTLTAEDASFYAEKGIRLSTSKGNDAADGSFFTVNNAYVVVGNSGSFSNSKTAGKFTIDVNNSVFDASQIYFSESSDVIDMSFDNSDIKTSIFMTEDKDSVYALKDSTLIATGTGTDRYNGNGGSLTVTNSDITIVQGAYTNNGTIVLTDSTLSAGSIVNNGTISITVTGTMLDSIIDNVWILNQDSATAAALNIGVTINNVVHNVGSEFEYKGSKFAVTSGLDGNDIVIERVVETAYVNEAWAGAEYGDKVAEGKFYLVNAFSSVSDALNNSDAAELVLESNITSDNFDTLKNVKLSTTVEGGVTINNTYDNWLYISGGAVIGENVTVNTPYAFMYGNGNKFDGKLNVAGQCYRAYDNVIEIGANGYVGCNGEAFIIRYNSGNDSIGGFKITGNDALGADISTRDVQLYGNYFSFYSGTVDAKDTKIYGGQIDMTNTTDGSGKAVIKLDNSVWVSDGHLQMTGNSSITLSNKSTLQINNIHGNRSSDTLDATSSITADDSVLSSKALDNAGTITLTNGSKLNVTGTLNNTGKINLAGANFSAGMITGSRLGADDKAYFNINASDAVTTLNIRDGFEQVIDVNRNGAAGDKVTLTGNVKTSSTANSVIRTYNDVELSNFKVDAVDKAGVGKLFTDGNIAITNNSDINVNWFQVKGNGVIEAGSIVTAPNVNIYDHKTIADTTFTVNGTLKADSLIVTNALYSEYYPEVNGPDGYNTNSVSNFVVGKDGVVESIGTNGRISLQIGHMTVYGYVNANTSTGGGMSWIGSDSEANEYNFCEMTLTVDGTYASEDSNNGKFINRGNQTLQINKVSDLNVVKGATFSWAGAINNGGTITVDANSTFYAGSINNYANGKTGSSIGSFNSTVSGEMIVLGDMTVAGCISTQKLVLNAGATLSVGSLSVENLELNFGSDLAVNGTGSNVGKITIVGELIPQNAEYVLVSSGWANLGETSVWYNNAEYTVVDSAENLSGINFVTIGGNLYVKDFGAATTGIYIGSDVDGLADGTKVTTADGVTYTVGVDAFASIADAKTVLGNKVSDISSIVVDKGETVVDANEAVFGDDLVINNAGHLDANIVAGDTMTITNSSVNTLLGSYTADYEINIDNAGGMIGDAAEDATVFNTSYMSVNGGDAANVEVNAGILELTDTDSFGVNADSGIIKGDDWGLGGTILLNGSANMSIDGDFASSDASSDVVVRADMGHTGTLTLNGDQKYTNTIGAANIVISNGSDVTLEDVTFRDMTISADAKLNVNPDSLNSFTQAGAFHGTGTLNTTQTGAWIVNDSVYRDLTDFAGTVTMENNGASIVMGKGDALSTLEAADSYFANGTNMVVKNSQSVVLAGSGISTGINFSGNGTLNVGNYDGEFVDGSNDFTQTLTGNNANFTGTVNVSEGAQLTVESALGATAINMDYNSNVNATGAADDTQLNLNKDGLALNAKITGDANDVINVKENASLEADEALNGFAGTVNVSDEKTIQLNGENTTAAIFNGSASAVIDANADQTLAADGALNGFEGTVELEGNKLTLNGENTTSAKFTGTNVIDANADQTLTAEGALNGFEGTVELEGNKLTLNGENTTAAKFTGSNVIDANKDQTLNAEGALDGFSGTVELEGNKLTLNGENTTTAAKFTGTNVIDANAAQTLTAAGALDGFSGTVELEGNKLTLNGANETSAKFTGSNVIDANADQTLTAAGALDGFSGTVELEGNKLTLNGANTTSAKFTGTNVIDANADQTLNAEGALDGFSGTVELESNDITLNGKNTTAAEFVGDANAAINVNANTVLQADNVNFDGKLNIDSAVEVQFDGDFGTVGGNSVISFNADNSSIYVAPGYAVDINSKLVSDSVTGEIFYVGGEATLTAEGALDDFDGLVRLSDKTEATKIILEGDNTTAATFMSVNYNTLHSIVLNGGDLTLTNSKALEEFCGKVNVSSDELTFDAADTGVFKTTAVFQGAADAVINVNSDVKLWGTTSDRNWGDSKTGNGALDGFAGTIKVADDTTLTLQGSNTTDAVFNGGVDSTLTISGGSSPNPTTNTFNVADAISSFDGTINLGAGYEKNTLVLNGENTTSAKFNGNSTAIIDANADQTLTANGALNGFTGTVELEGNKLTLNGANETAATITGTNTIAANADQVFTGDVTGFTGEFVIAADKSVTLSGTFADAENSVVNASGATLNLADKSVAVTVNGGTGLNALNFGNNSLTLGTGDFTNVNGTGSVVFAAGHTDNNFASLTASDVTLTGGRDINATTFDGDLNITIDTADNNVADVITGSTYGDTIYVNITNDALLSGNDYNLITAGDYTITSIQLFDNVTNSWLTLNFNDGVKANGFTYTLRETYDHTLVLNQLAGFSNFVVINAAWSNKVPYQQVDDNGVDRSFGFDAASDLAQAVEYIRGWNVGQGWDNGHLQMGDAKIELVAGKYSLATGTLMTSANGVTQLTIAARDGETATLTGVLRGSDGSTATTLTIEDTRIQATELYGGGTLVINNGADDKSSGNVIAAGIGNTTANSEVVMTNDSALVINGGYFNNRILVGGSVANAEGAKVTVNGDTSLVIDNNSGETLTIAGNIYGGSWAAKGEVVQTGNASVTINADEALNIRGNIYVNGGASANGTLTMSGNSTITFTGNADNLTFTGSVNAKQTDNDEIVVFNDFHNGDSAYPLTIGSFNGSLVGFDSIVISGDSAISFARRQASAANTSITFDIDGRSGYSNKVAGVAMYTVRDPNNWEFSTNIVIDSATNSYDGYDYVLVDNYAGDFSQFNFTVAGNDNYTIGDWTYDVNGAAYKLYVDDSNKLLLQYVKASNNVVVEQDTADLAITNAKLITVADGVTAKTTDALNLEEITLGGGASLEVSDKNRKLAEVTLGNGSTLTLNYNDGNPDAKGSGTMDNLNMQVANAGDTATVVWDEGGNWDYAAGYTVGEGVTLQTAKTVINGGNAVQIDGTVESNYFYMLDGDVNVTGTLVGKGDAIQVKGGSQLNVDGGTVDARTSINVWVGDAALNVNNGTVNLSAGHIHLWDGAVTANFTDSTVGYGSDFIVGNAGNGAVMTVDNSTMSQSVVSDTAVSTINSGNRMIVQNGSEINLGAAGMAVHGTGLAADPGAALEVYGSVINGNIKGSDAADAITIDVDAVLNGTVSGVENLSITGISSLTTDVAGAKAVVGSVDSALANVKIDDVDAVLGYATQVAGTATTDDASDDVWASLNQNTDGSLVVAWGRSNAEVGAALEAFRADSTLSLGEALVADAASLADGAEVADFDTKKNNGTLA